MANNLKSAYGNTPGYKILCQLIPEIASRGPISQYELDHLLSVLGGPHSLQSLILVLENFAEITKRTGGICKSAGFSFVDELIKEAKVTCQALVDAKDIIEKKVGLFSGRDGSSREDSFRGLVRQSPLYARMGLLPQNRLYCPQFYLLMAEIFVAHLVAVCRGQNEGLNSQLTSALNAVQKLTKTEDLAKFPTEEAPPLAYCKQLKSHPERNLVRPIVRYLALASSPRALKRSNKRVPSADRGPSKGKPLTEVLRKGLFEPESPPPTELVEAPGDIEASQAPAPPGSLIFIAKPSLAFLPDPEFSMAAEGLKKSRALENQQFHFSWRVLNQHDLKNLFDYLFPENSATVGSNIPTRTQLGLIFMAGLTPERLAKMDLVRPGQQAPEADAYIESISTLRVFSPGPELKSVLSPAGFAQSCPTQNYIDLKLPDYLANRINDYLSDGYAGEGMKLFRNSADDIQAACRQALGGLKKKFGGRLSFKRVLNHMARKLALLSGNDHAGASFIQGKDNIYLAQTPVHYASFEAGILQRLCDLAWTHTAREAGREVLFLETFPADLSRYVGTPLRPDLVAVRGLIAAVKTFLEENSQIDSLEKLVDFHNAYVLYTFLMITYCTGYRAVTSPFVTEEMYDPVTGFCVIRDKSSADFYHSRLVWLPDDCIEQLKNFEQHLEAIKKNSVFPIPDTTRKDGIFFFLSTDGRRETVRPSNLKIHLEKFGFYLPVNVSRHFIKSELQERGCSTEIVELLLGHWHLGQEGWAKTSALHPWDFKSELQRHLPPLLNRLGLVPLKGLKRAPKRFRLLLHERTPQEAREFRRRTSKRTSNRFRNFFAQHEPGEAWVEILSEYFRGKQGADRFKKQERLVLIKMQALLPELFKGKRGITIATEDLQLLMRRLQPRPMHLKHHLRRLNFLIDGLVWGKKNRDWVVEIPARPVFTLNPQNFARPSLVRKMKKFRRIEQAFIADLKGPVPDVPEARIGQILISAILFGGLHHSTWAEGFVSGLTEDLFQWGDMLWVDLWSKPKNYHAPEEKWFLQRNPDLYRRWLADPTTQLLIYRWRRKLAGTKIDHTQFQIVSVYKAYGEHLKKNQGFTLPPLSDLFSAGNAWEILTKPSYLAAYATNQIQAASLPDPAWMRLLTGEIVPTLTGPTRQKKRSSNLTNGGNQPDQADILKDLRSLIRTYDSTESLQNSLTGAIHGFFADNEEKLWPIAELLVEWAVQLLSDQIYELELRHKKTPLAPNTVSNYLEQISASLLEVVSEEDITDFEFQELSTTMLAVAESIKRRRVHNFTNPQAHELAQLEDDLARLNQFFGFLHCFHSTPKLSIHIEKNVLTVHGGDAVRANLVTIHEYRLLLKRLGWGKPMLTRFEKMTLVAAILAFRCGMRVLEIWGLQLGDMQGTDRLELLVQGNDFRGLKTRASKRREPLFILLPAEEFEFVRNWHRFRQAEIGSTPRSPLFSTGPMETEPCNFNDLLAPLRNALREMTGDLATVPHTLRHSFASWLQVAIQLRDDIDSGACGCFLNAPEFGRAQRQRLKKTLLENENTGRKSLYVGAALLGHADTQTELHNYIHLCDWLHWYFSRHPSCCPPLKAANLVQIASISESYAHKVVARKGHFLLELLSHITDRYSDKILLPRKTETRARPTIQNIPVSSSPLEDFDCAFQKIFGRSELPSHLSWPKSQEGIRTLECLYGRVLALDGLGQQNALELAPKLSAIYQHYDRSMTLDDLELAPKIIDLLKTLGVRFTAQHHRSRWVREAKFQTAGYLVWKETLRGVPLWRGRQQCGRNLEKGAIRLSLQAIERGDHVLNFDSTAARVFGLFTHLLCSQYRG